MEINSESLRSRYEKMETKELTSLYLHGVLTDIARGVLENILDERGVKNNARPKLVHPIDFCSSKQVEDGREMGLIMSNSRLSEVLDNWRRNRPGKVFVLLVAACTYFTISAVFIMFIGSIESILGKLVVAAFIAASTIAALKRLFLAAEEGFGNDRVRHMRAVLKAGGYPPAELVEKSARDAEYARKLEDERATEKARSRGLSRPSIQLSVGPRVRSSNLAPKNTNAYNGDVTSAAFLQSYEWRKLRMEALKLHGACCQCCGASRADGAKIHVDHIKPRKYFPELALEIDNLQVLCHECNHGKGNWDMTSWKDRQSS